MPENQKNIFTALPKLPILAGMVNRFDRRVGKFSLPLAVRDLITRTESRLLVHNLSPKTREILKSGSGLIVANHNFDTEMIPLLASLPPREDIYLVGTTDLLTIGPHTSKHIIPVQIRDHVYSSSHKLSSRLSQIIRFGTRMSDDKAKEFNTHAIKIASEKINQGGLVIFFPEGASGRQRWFKGIGYLLKSLKTQRKSYITNAYVGGTSNFDWFRILFGRLFPDFSIHFSSPRLIKDIHLEKHDANTITKRLSKNYYKWMEIIKQGIRHPKLSFEIS